MPVNICNVVTAKRAMVSHVVKPGYNAKVAIILLIIAADIFLSSVADHAPLAGTQWWAPYTYIG